MSIEEDFEEWWAYMPGVRGSVTYNIAKAAWRRCATLAKERITDVKEWEDIGVRSEQIISYPIGEIKND